MIHVDYKEVQFGISKTMADNVPLFDKFYALAPDASTKATLTSDLHTLFIALMHKYGATKAIDMIQLALEHVVEDYKSSKITDLSKKNKGDN